MARIQLRHRILGFVCALVLLTLLGSSVSLYRISEVNRTLEDITRFSMQTGRLMIQLQSDSEMYRRELDRRFNTSHWNDPHWRVRPAQRWIEELITSELDQARAVINESKIFLDTDRWMNWQENIHDDFEKIRLGSLELYTALDRRDLIEANHLYPNWSAKVEAWVKQVQWGVDEYERALKQIFNQSQSQISSLKMGLQMILAAVISLSLLLLWLGERALRPLSDLTHLAKQIARRGLRKEDKAALPWVSLDRADEVSELAREFKRMATALLEREKMFSEQNRLLWEMGELNRNILSSIRSILVVTDSSGKITQCNEAAAKFFGLAEEKLRNQALFELDPLRSNSATQKWQEQIHRGKGDFRIEPFQVNDKFFGGHWMRLVQIVESGENVTGSILSLDDLTESMDLQTRLSQAEKLAAVGRVSAQVAHEIRNPLHSIGLEAEVALERESVQSDSQVKLALQSILVSVERLDKITKNYLKLSKLSTGERKVFDLGDALESVLATYSPVCEAGGIQVDWKRSHESLYVLADRDLIENVLGNLFRNALQALQSAQPKNPRIWFELGLSAEGKVQISISDNGPGISPAIRDRLFTPFVTTKADGTGLGLSFARKVVEDHGGELQVIQKGPLTGAEFVVSLPLERNSNV